MKLKKNGDFIYVELSERNLRQLVEVWDRHGDSSLRQRQMDGSWLTVRIARDAEHYEGRTPGPAMDPLLKLAEASD